MRRSNHRQLDARIVALTKEHGFATALFVARKLAVEKGLAQERLSSLLARGYIQKTGTRGSYAPVVRDDR